MKIKPFIISLVIVSLFLFTFVYVPSSYDYYSLDKNNIPDKYVPFGYPFMEQFEEPEPTLLENIFLFLNKIKGDGWYQRYQKH